MGRKIVVTGASGFVGQALLNQLRIDGVSATGVSRRGMQGIAAVSSYADILAPKNAVLVHLAQGRDASSSYDNGDIELCQVLSRMPWRHVVYASSAVVYGDSVQHRRRPEESVAAAGDYARVKLACEDIVLGIGGTCLRFSNIYGPGMGPNTVVADIVRQIPGSGPLKLRDARPVRDFLWIEDAARCIVAATRNLPGLVLNAGTGDGTSVGDVARLALSLAGESSRPVVSTSDSDRSSCLTVDITETRSTLGWSPEVDISSGLSALIRLKNNDK